MPTSLLTDEAPPADAAAPATAPFARVPLPPWLGGKGPPTEAGASGGFWPALAVAIAEGLVAAGRPAVAKPMQALRNIIRLAQRVCAKSVEAGRAIEVRPLLVRPPLHSLAAHSFLHHHHHPRTPLLVARRI